MCWLRKSLNNISTVFCMFRFLKKRKRKNDEGNPKRHYPDPSSMEKDLERRRPQQASKEEKRVEKEPAVSTT